MFLSYSVLFVQSVIISTPYSTIRELDFQGCEETSHYVCMQIILEFYRLLEQKVNSATVYCKSLTLEICKFT
jgi:hypothetical protein